MGPGILVALAVTAASSAYQYKQQKKMKKKAREAAEARKGFEIAAEGEVIALPIVYGKAKIAGTRVFHKTFNGFSSPEDPAVVEEENPEITVYKNVFVKSEPLPYNLSSNADVLFQVADDSFFKLGSKNEFLIFQQALCHGPIHACKDLVIDDSIYLNSPSLSVKAGFVAAVHYAGNKADSIAVVAAPERKDAIFTDTAYATVVIKLNRDDPQFGGVPDVAFFIEGKLVRDLTNGQLGSRIYSNNPALVLLDYLLDYRKLSPDQIDLVSFQEAANTCNKPVLSNAIVGGNFYRPALSTSFQQTRPISLYECNIVLDSSKPHRENIEAILETMGDARLVWSQGKYKLSLQYPGVDNQGVFIADHITDERLVLGEDISVSWPSAEERYNNVVVRFSNESENFKEDTVSWPPKKYGIYERGIGGFVYPAVSGWDSGKGGRFLNNYAVWNGATQTTNVNYKIKPKISGSYKLEFAIDDSGSLSIAGQTFPKTGGWDEIHTHMITLNADTVYDISINGGNGKNLKGVAAVLTGPDNLVLWTTRDPSYTGFETVERDDSVYLEMLAEDNNVELETDLFFEGCTDYYHALAKAEEVCRTSRTAFTIKFTYLFEDRYLEPGDIISFSSETVKLGSSSPILVRVDSVKLKNGLAAEIEGTRFDWTQLAWNVSDNEYIKPIPSYDSILPAPLSLSYEPADKLLKDTGGSLVWPLVDDARVSSYELLVVEPDDISESGSYNFKSLGLSPTSPFALPALSGESYIFGVRSVANSGAKSSITITSQLDLSRLAPPKATNLFAEVFGEANNSVRLSWVIPGKRTDGSDYGNHFLTEVYKSKTDNFSTAKKIADVYGTSEYIDSITDLGEVFYWVILVSYGGVKGPPSDSASIFLDYNELENSTTVKPPSPLNLTVAATFTQMILMWEIPQYSEGGGHKATIIYAQKFEEGLPVPTIASAQVIAKLDGYITQYVFPAALGERWYFFARSQNNYGGISEGYAGPAIGQTGLIGGHDLGPLIVEAENIANGGITAQKFIEGIEPVVLWEEKTLPTTNEGAVLTWKGKLYRWNGSSYTSSVPTVDLVGQIVGPQIADAAINTAKFAQGIEPVSVISGSTLPSTKGTNTIYFQGKLHRWDGTKYTAAIPSSDILGQLTNNQIADIAAAKLTGQITGVQISDNAISAPKILAGAITTAKIAAGAITADTISTNAITSTKISAGAVSADKIAANSITAGQIAAGAINAEELAAGAVTAAKISAGAVTADAIAANAVTASKIAAGSVSADKIAANSITAGQIATGAIVSDKIAAGAIVAGKIAAAAVGATNIMAGAIVADSAIIAEGAITTAKLGAASVDTLKIAGEAVTIPRGANGTWSASININLPQPGRLLMIGTFTQGAGRGGQPVTLELIHNGVVYPIGTETPAAATTGAISVTTGILAAGVHTCRIRAVNQVGDFRCGIAVLGAMR
jgi:hypothetical protein